MTSHSSGSALPSCGSERVHRGAAAPGMERRVLLCILRRCLGKLGAWRRGLSWPQLCFVDLLVHDPRVSEQASAPMAACTRDSNDVLPGTWAKQLVGSSRHECECDACRKRTHERGQPAARRAPRMRGAIWSPPNVGMRRTDRRAARLGAAGVGSSSGRTGRAGRGAGPEGA
eukprot:343596-Chlamydomonas_euryale.AAC.6